jgi:hypothetical protein
MGPMKSDQRLALGLGLAAVLTACTASVSVPDVSPSGVLTPKADAAADARATQQMQLAAWEMEPITHFSNAQGQPVWVDAAGWTMIDDRPMTLSSNQPGCVARPPHYLAGQYREYSYALNANGLEAGHAFVSVMAADSAADVARLQQDLAATTYIDCYATGIRDDLSAIPGVTLTGDTSRALQTSDVGVPSLTYVFRTPYQFQNGAKVLNTTVSWISYSRYRAIVQVQTCACEGLPSIENQQPDVVVIAQRMRRIADGQ